jgi:hypothetical protein
MALQAETIAAGLVAAWQADSTIQSLVPGGIWYGQAPQEDTTLRAVFSIATEGQIVKTSTRDYLQNISITLQLYGVKPMTSSDWLNIRVRINEIWCITTPSISGATLIDLDPSSSSVELAPDRRDGEDMLVAKASFSGMVQGVF